MRIGWHGLGVLAMAVSLTDSYGHPEDGQSVAPQIEKGDGPTRQTRQGGVHESHANGDRLKLERSNWTNRYGPTTRRIRRTLYNDPDSLRDSLWLQSIDQPCLSRAPSNATR